MGLKARRSFDGFANPMTMLAGRPGAGKPVRNTRAMAGLLGLLMGVSASTMACAAAPAWTDTFTSLNSTRWYVSNGWSDGSWMLNYWEQSQLSTGVQGLAITLNKSAVAPSGYASGEIQSRSQFQYGYYEVRMQAAAGSGLDSGFFTYTGASQGRNWNEIDVEVLGRNTHAVSLTYHNGNQQVSTAVNLSFDASAAQHIYAFDWEPQYIRWYVDNKMVLQVTGSQLAIPNEPQNLILDMWASNSFPQWLGGFNWLGRPLVTQISCVATAPSYSGKVIC